MQLHEFKSRSFTVFLSVTFGGLFAITFLGAMGGSCSTAVAQGRSVALLQQAVASGAAKDRQAAVDALGKMGAQARAALPALLKALTDKDVELRRRAARAIGSIGGDAGTAAALAKGLKDEDAAVRAYCASALGKLGDVARPLAPALVAASLDKDATVRREVLEALRTIKPDREKIIPLMTKALQDADPDTVMHALHSLAEFGKDAVPAMIDALKHDQACYWACLVLAEIGPDAKDATLPVAALLKSDEPETKMQALVTLGEIGPEARAAVPAVLAAMESAETAAVRYSAAYALGKIKPADRLTINALRKATTAGDPFMKVVSAWALVEQNPNDKQTAKQVFQIIVDGIQSPDKHVRIVSARALAETSATTDVSAPALIAALKDADPVVIDQAIDTLASLGAAAVPRLKQGLVDPTLRNVAIVVVRKIGPQAAETLPVLIQQMGQTLPDEFRQEVHFAVGAMGAAAKDAVPAVARSLNSTTEEVRFSACYALGKIGPAASAALPQLRQLTKSNDEFQQVAAIWAVMKIDPAAEDLIDTAVPLLTKALGSDREHVRAEAAGSLGDLGNAAKDAIAALQKLAGNDTSPGVRAAAKQAVARIQSKPGAIKGTLLRSRGRSKVSSRTFKITIEGPGVRRTVNYNRAGFEIGNLPPGKYTVSASGQILGTKHSGSASVVVKSGETESVEIVVK